MGNATIAKGAAMKKEERTKVGHRSYALVSTSFLYNCNIRSITYTYIRHICFFTFLDSLCSWANMALRYIWGGTNHEKAAEASPMPSLAFLQQWATNGPPEIRHFGVSLVGRWWSNDVYYLGFVVCSFSAHDTYCDVWIRFLFKMPFHYSGKWIHVR